MTLDDIKRILRAEVIVGEDRLNQQIKMACGSDLMSDVLSFVKGGSLLLTGLTNAQVVRTAEMSDIAAICFVRGKKPDRQAVEMAESKNIPMLTTGMSMFEACGRLWRHGLRACFEQKK